MNVATPGKLIDISNKRFGKLVALYRDGNIGHSAAWRCKCDCGNNVRVNGHDLRSGHTKSCGCFRKESSVIHGTTHGKSSTSIYHIWHSMIGRCTRASDRAYKWYGGRGITVCNGWMKFENFYVDMGEYPIGMQLERIDNSKGYSKENCKWATRKEQCCNRRSNVYIFANGEQKTLSQWSEITGMKPETINKRMRVSGWTASEAINTPKRKKPTGETI